MSIDQLTQEALSLPSDLRLQLAEKLLASLEVDDYIQSEWLAEAEQRQNEIRNRLVQPIPGDEALEKVRKILG